MVARGEQSSEPEWKQFLRLGEDLLNQPTAADQRRLIAAAIRERLGAKAEVWLAHPYYPLPGEPDKKILPSAHAPELIRRAYEEREPCCQSKQGVRPAWSCVEEGAEHPNLVAVPLITQGNMLGIIQVQRKKPFDMPDLEFLEGLASHAAMNLQISRQVAIKNWRNGQLVLVSSVSAQIANLPNLDELCQRVTDLIEGTFHYYYVAIFILNESDQALSFCACTGRANTPDNLPHPTVRIGEGIVGAVGQSGEEVLASDVRLEPRYHYVDTLPGTRSELALPLKVENRILGVLDVQSDQVDAFHETDQLVLRALADNIALAVEGTRLYETLERRAAQITAVLEVSRALTSILDLDKLLEAVVELIHRRFGYPYVHLFTVHAGRRLIFYRAGAGERSKAYRERNLTYHLDDPRGIIPWVARTGQPLLANDVSKEPHYRQDALPPFGTNSELTLPLKFGDEVMGILDIQSDHPNAFDEKDESLLEALSASIAISLRNATLYRSEQWRHQVAESFRDVAGLLPTHIELEDMLNRILVSLETNLPCEASAIWLVEESPNGELSLKLAASRGVDPQVIVQARERSAIVRGWLDRALTQREPLIRRPTDPYGPLGVALDLPADYSSIACPLSAGDSSLGVLTLAHRTAGRYGSEARDMVATFASYAAIAIQNARLYQESQEQAWISTVLLQVAEANQAVTTMDELLANTVRLLPLLVGVKKAGVFLWDPAQEAFVLSETYEIEKPEKGTRFYEKDASALARLAATKATLFVQNPLEELDLPAAALSEGNGTLVLVPMLARGELMGAMLVAHEGGARAGQGFNDQTLSILQGIAHQTAIAVENLRLVEARQEEAYVTAVLLQVAQAVVSLNNLNDILDTIVHLMPILVGIDACIIYLWDRANRVFVPSEAFSGLRGEERELLARTYGAGEFALLDDVRQYDTFLLCPLNEAGAHPKEWPRLPTLPPGKLPPRGLSSVGGWLIGVPLSVKGEVYGVMLAKEINGSTPVHERRMEIISGIAQEVALAVQNEELQQEMVVRERIEREIQLAREIQRTFLPNQLPQPPGWEIDARWETAHEVGGDFYDIFKVGDHKLGIVIADVADKGMPAALYMTVTRALIRASVHYIHSPARVLERVNNLLVPDAQNGMFVTAVFATLAVDSGELIYANAGHNRPILVRSEGNRLEVLPKGGMALGVEESIPLHDQTVHMEPGDCLILYTDGVTDTFNPSGLAFGEERLEAVLTAAEGDTAAQVLDAVENTLAQFRGQEPVGDDVTLVAVKRAIR